MPVTLYSFPMAVTTKPLAERHHLVVGGVTVALALGLLVLTGLTPERWVDIDQAKADTWNWRLSTASADTSLILLVATLTVGPWRVLRGRRPSIHRPLRRALGIWAGAMGLLHVAFALFIHANGLGVWENWFVSAPSLSDPFTLLRGKRGLANWIGLAQAGLIVVLLVASRDKALRQLGPVWWKRVQRSSYVLMGLIAVHVLLFQSIEQRINRHRIPVLLLLVFVVVVQLGAVVTVRRRAASPTPEMA